MEDGQINGNAVPIHPLEGADAPVIDAAAAYSGTANAEMQAEIAKVMQPKLVRHLIEQRRDEALFEATRLQNMLDQAPAALLDCTQAMAQNIFG